MGIYHYTPELSKRITQVCQDPAYIIFSDFTDIEIASIQEMLECFYKFAADNQSVLGTKSYVLRIDFSTSSSSNPLQVENILEALRNQQESIVCDSTLGYLRSEKIEGLSDSQLGMYSKQTRGALLYMINGQDTKIYSLGVPIKEINILNPYAQPPVHKRFNRAAQDYRSSLRDFYKEIIRSNRSEHWHNRTKRILKGGKTEEVFQKAMFAWLRDNITMGKVIEKVKKVSNDETDFEIIAHGGNSYLIELKWMGTNGKTEYGTEKVEGAINQVKNYLELDGEIIDATLVVFDGRMLEEFESIECTGHYETGNWREIKKCNDAELPINAVGYVYFLISESASKRKSA